MQDRSDFEPAKLLDNAVLRRNLTLCALYIGAYEMLKDAIVDQIRKHFIPEHWSEPAREAAMRRYEIEVHRRHKRELEAALRWLVEANAITEEEAVFVASVTEHRNLIVHELVRFLTDRHREVRTEDLTRIQRLVRKIDAWWATNVDFSVLAAIGEISEVPDQSEVHSGPSLVLQYILEAASRLEAGDSSLH